MHIKAMMRYAMMAKLWAKSIINSQHIFARKFVYISKLHTRSQTGLGLDLGR